MSLIPYSLFPVQTSCCHVILRVYKVDFKLQPIGSLLGSVAIWWQFGPQDGEPERHRHLRNWNTWDTQRSWHPLSSWESLKARDLTHVEQLTDLYLDILNPQLCTVLFYSSETKCIFKVLWHQYHSPSSIVLKNHHQIYPHMDLVITQ